MRNILLATTALAAVVGFASAANAQIKVTLGGYTEFFAAIYDNNLVNGTDREFQLETEIVVRADGKADNGLLYGTKVELQNGTSTSVGTDEASVYLGGTWGRLELGDFDGAADTLKIYAPVIGIEQIDGDAYDFLGAESATGLSLGSQIAFGIHIPNSGDATKVMYLTPRFAGFQAGFSYTPENGDEGQSVVGLKNTSGYSDFLEYGINYTGNFDGVTVAASATGTSGTASRSSSSTRSAGRSVPSSGTSRASYPGGSAASSASSRIRPKRCSSCTGSLNTCRVRWHCNGSPASTRNATNGTWNASRPNSMT